MTPNFSFTGIPKKGYELAVNRGGNLCSGGGDTFWLMDGTQVPLEGACDTTNYACSPSPRNGPETLAPNGSIALVSYSWDTINGGRQFLSVQTDKNHALRVAHLLGKKYGYNLVINTLSFWGGYWGRILAVLISGSMSECERYRGSRNLVEFWRELCQYKDGWQGILPISVQKNLPAAT